MVTEQYAAGALDGSVDPEELTTLLAQENQDLLAAITQLKAENAELRRDAERYRWLRDSGYLENWAQVHPCDVGREAEFTNEAIDRAMKAMTKEKQ